jgi:zinc transport system substrate-binding protein
MVIAMVALAVACTAPRGPEGGNDERLEVMVSILPQRTFLERIGGDRVRVSVMVEPGASPATYEPKPAQLKALSRSAAYFSIGVPFEDAWLSKIVAANPEMAIVDTIAAIERMPMQAHGHDDDDADAGDTDHAEGAPDPHVWLSPALVKLQAEAICDALVALDPTHGNAYRANRDAFLADVDALDAEIGARLEGIAGARFLVFHPSWGYFARDYGLEQIAIEVGGQEPSAQELARLIEEAREEGIRVVFAQPEFSTQDAETIAREIDGEVLLVSPLDADWVGNLRRVARTFADVLEPD